jgi:argininosuccinate synthase
MLEDPWFDSSQASNREMFVLSVSPEEAPDQAEIVELLFQKGDCIGLRCDRLGDLSASMKLTSLGEKDGYTLFSPYGIMKILNRLGGDHGVGRVDMVENRFVGMKSRGVYETPGGAILLAAHRDLESLTMDREVMLLRDSLIPKYAQLVYNGFWFAPERHALQALVTESQQNVTGEVRVKLYKGNVIRAGRKSPRSLYREAVATMEADPTQAYNQDDATGFIRLNGLRLKNEALRDQRSS